MTEEKKRHGVLFWIGVLVGTAIALFVGSAVVAGIMEANERQDTRQKATSLTDVNVLQKMILTKMDARRGVSLACWYTAAIGYRLAEARDLKIAKAEAVDLANDQYLVAELVKNGFNSKYVITGLATIVYDSPLTPRASFDAELDACGHDKG